MLEANVISPDAARGRPGPPSFCLGGAALGLERRQGMKNKIKGGYFGFAPGSWSRVPRVGPRVAAEEKLSRGEGTCAFEHPCPCPRPLCCTPDLGQRSAGKLPALSNLRAKLLLGCSVACAGRTVRVLQPELAAFSPSTFRPAAASGVPGVNRRYFFPFSLFFFP